MIGTKTIAYKYRHLFLPGNTFTEIAENASVDLPEIAEKSDAISGAGIMGEIEMPVKGQYGNMKVTVAYRTSLLNFEKATTPGLHTMEFSQAVQVINPASGETVTQYVKYYCKGYKAMSKPGKLEQGGEMDASAEYNLIYYKKTIDGVVVREIDKLNGVDKVNGVEYYQDIISNL